MFIISKIEFLENPIVTEPIPDYKFKNNNIDFFDKDGYELSKLEQAYYYNQGYSLSTYTADHVGFFEPWINIEHKNLSIDHSCIMYRCSFEDAAKEQIQNNKHNNFRVGWLLTSRKKWGLDINIDYCDENIALEVIHLEWDAYDLDTVKNQKQQAEKFLLSVDWIDAAKTIWNKRDQWQNLNGWYAQAHWKATYFGFERPWY